MMSLEQQRDFSANYHVMNLSELVKLTVLDDFDWVDFLGTFFTEDPVKPTEKIAIYAQDYFSGLAEIVKSTEYNILHNYVVWLGIKSLIYTLSEDFQILRYDLVLKVNGVDLSCNERWRICTEHARDS